MKKKFISLVFAFASTSAFAQALQPMKFRPCNRWIDSSDGASKCADVGSEIEVYNTRDVDAKIKALETALTKLQWRVESLEAFVIRP